MKDINHKLKPYLLILLTLILAFLLFLLSSCSQAKLGQNAVNRVNADATLQDKVVSKWFDTHPIDTTPRIFVSPPKIIEVPTPKIVRDEAALKASIDSFKATLDTTKDCGEAAMDAFNLGYEQAETKYLSQKTKVSCPPDTTKIYYLTHELNRWKDSAKSKSELISYQKGQLDTRNETLKQQSQKITQLYLWIFGIAAIGVLSHVLRSYAGNWIGSAKKLFTKS